MTSLVTDNNLSTENERRRLRQEQDVAYQASLKEDQETEVQERIQSIKNVVGSPDNVTEEKPKITNDLFEELFGEKR